MAKTNASRRIEPNAFAIGSAMRDDLVHMLNDATGARGLWR